MSKRLTGRAPRSVKYGSIAAAALLASIGELAFALTANAQPAPAAAAASAKAQPPGQPSGSLILGELTRIAVRDVNDPASGGEIVVDGKTIAIPDRLQVGLPTGRVPLRDLMLEAPAECKAKQPPQSGLAVTDSCRRDAPPALARVVASPDKSGALVASLVMIQKDSSQTLARIKPTARTRPHSYGQQSSDAAATPKKPDTPAKVR